MLVKNSDDMAAALAEAYLKIFTKAVDRTPTPHEANMIKESLQKLVQLAKVEQELANARTLLDIKKVESIWKPT